LHRSEIEKDYGVAIASVPHSAFEKYWMIKE
jgi:hypothetical protein